MTTGLFDAAGQRILGHLDDSAGGGTPALILVHEWWGVNGHIKDVCARFAKEGFVVFAPDFYAGRVATTEEEANALMMGVDREAAVGLVLRATAALKARLLGKKVGVTGFCFGGAVALGCAARIPGLSACVVFYGLPPTLDASQIRCAVQGHFAREDGWCTPAKVDALEAKLRAAGVREELFRYEAQHAFMNDTRPEVHSPDQARLAWGRAVTFLKRELSPPLR